MKVFDLLNSKDCSSAQYSESDGWTYGLITVSTGMSFRHMVYLGKGHTMRSENIEISQNGNLLIYKPGYTADFVSWAIEGHQLDGLRIWTDPLVEPPEDLGFLREYSFLKALDVTSVYDYPFDFLADLPHLQKLSINIEGSKEIDLVQQTELESLVLKWRSGKVKNLERCTKLRYLSLIGFREVDLSPIRSLRTIRNLRIKTGSVKTLSGIDQFLELHHVLLGNCKSLETLNAVSSLTKLRSLEVDTCPKIEDWEALTDLPGLEYLRMTNCKNVRSIKFLESLPSLKKIVLNGNTKVVDGNLAPAKAVPEHWI